jgi:hypothetical protein
MSTGVHFGGDGDRGSDRPVPDGSRSAAEIPRASPWMTRLLWLSAPVKRAWACETLEDVEGNDYDMSFPRTGDVESSIR